MVPGEIQPLMAVQVGRWGPPAGPMGGPPMGPPRMMGPPPPLMDFGKRFLQTYCTCFFAIHFT